MIRRILGLIPRCLQLLIEIGGILIAYNMAKLLFNDFFDDFFVTLFTIYFVSIITLIIGWIFNIFTKFDDYSRGGRLHTILLAPIMLPYRLLIHTYSTIGFLFTGKDGTESHSSIDSTSSKSSQSYGSGINGAIKRAVWGASNQLFIENCTSARCIGEECWISNFHVHVTVTYELYNTNTAISGDDISGLKSQVMSSIKSAIDDAISTNYTGNITWRYSIKVNTKISKSQYFF